MPRVQSAARADNFNPRSPHGERPAQRTWTSAWRDFNPRSPHGERRARRKRRSWSSPISIHAPRTGSDPCTKGGGADPAHFNPRSPHGERRSAGRSRGFESLFQSTLPARGATVDCRNAKLDAENFNPRSPHGERHGDLHELDYPLKFQSTLPARGATRRAVQNKSPRQFQSTLPARGATFVLGGVAETIQISIHAPRTGSDWIARASAYIAANFNPRSPHGERRRGLPEC